ncbi:MAG: modification methylase [Chloroflexi bacterium HGW-Chloroflexi-3]|nr:MAG: modification methylase [Chloroflexi bacterium HGW-Chloroflexi-3]
MNRIAIDEDQIILGDCVEVMRQMESDSVDMIFADPPYNLQLKQQLYRPDLSHVEAVDDHWDKFDNFETYDQFTRDWLEAAKRILKPNGTLWVIGSYHNIYRVGSIIQDLGYWILNDVIWVKSNPMPNFRGVRLTNAHETLIWAQKQRGAPYTFNHHSLKMINDDLQMRSDWYFARCSGKERLKENGSRAHSTQKPLALLYRVLQVCTNEGDVVLDPFFGSGTTGAAARLLRRHFIGIEREESYVRIAAKRITGVTPLGEDFLLSQINPRREPRLPFGELIENGFLKPGTMLFFGENSDLAAQVMADGSLVLDGKRGSIHQLGRQLKNGPVNGWTAWFYHDETKGKRYPIDCLRQQLREYLTEKGDLES